MGAIVVLGVVWFFVVGGALLKLRTEERLESIEGFQRQLRSFGGGLPPLAGAPALGPPLRTRSMRMGADVEQVLRRILATLLVAVVVTFAYAVVASTRMAWGIHLLVDDGLLAYVAFLVHRRDRVRGTASGI